MKENHGHEGLKPGEMKLKDEKVKQRKAMDFGKKLGVWGMWGFVGLVIVVVFLVSLSLSAQSQLNQESNLKLTKK